LTTFYEVSRSAECGMTVDCTVLCDVVRVAQEMAPTVHMSTLVSSEMCVENGL
jgi:hypothetical protein